MEKEHDVVAVLPLGRRGIDLDAVVEIKKHRGAVTVGDEIVEGRQQDGLRPPLAVADALQRGQQIAVQIPRAGPFAVVVRQANLLDDAVPFQRGPRCPLYTSDAADQRSRVDLSCPGTLKTNKQ